MSAQTVKRRHTSLPRVESISRIQKVPIVQDGTQIASIVYGKIKRSNSLMNWGLDTAERSFMAATTLATPAINIFNGPITAIDHLLCKGIDVVEEKVPAVHMPSRQMYCSAKDYMASKIKPVLTRAESMTQIGSFVANATAERLNDALTNLEKRIDHYLPADPVDEVDYPPATKNISKTKLTVIHGVRCSRKLQRGLTRQTIAETRALMLLGQKFADVIKLVLTDPILAMQQATSLWKALSLPEPENQVRPSTVEESLVLLLREVSRRFVHAVNNVTAFVKANWKLKEDMFDIFRLWVDTIVSLRYYMIYSVFKLFLNEGDNDPKTDLAKNPIQLLSETIQKILTRIAMFIAGNPDAFKSVQDPSPQQNRNNHVSQPEREKKSSEREKKSSEKERNSSEKERNSLEKERNSSEKERNSSEKERNSSKKERNSSEKERNSSEKERNSLEKERNSSKKERNSSEEEKKSEERETENCHE